MEKRVVQYPILNIVHVRRVQGFQVSKNINNDELWKSHKWPTMKSKVNTPLISTNLNLI